MILGTNVFSAAVELLRLFLSSDSSFAPDDVPISDLIDQLPSCLIEDRYAAYLLGTTSAYHRTNKSQPFPHIVFDSKGHRGVRWKEVVAPPGISSKELHSSLGKKSGWLVYRSDLPISYLHNR